MNKLIDYLAGELNAEEVSALEQELIQSKALQEELEVLKAIHSEAIQLPEITPSPQLKVNFETLLAQEINQQEPTAKVVSMRSYHWLWRSVAAGVILFLGIFIGIKVNQFQVQKEQMAVLEEELKQTKLTMEALMQQTSTSRRIKAVNLTYDIPKADQEIINNLEYLLNRDESVNVRLTSLEALSQIAESSTAARRVLIDAMRYQDKPIVQIALIQSLVELKAQNALPVFEKLIEDEQIPNLVKDEAHLGKFKLEKI